MKAKIVSVRFTEGKLFGPPAQAIAKLEGSDEEIVLFSYFSDEINFSEDELVGLTVSEAHDLRHDKDVKFLRMA